MRAGRLDEKICIYCETKTTDADYGSETSSHATLFLTTRADVAFNNGNETLSNSTVSNTQAVIFWIRFREGIKETMQIEWRGERYNITYIESNRRTRLLRLQTDKILN